MANLPIRTKAINNLEFGLPMKVHYYLALLILLGLPACGKKKKSEKSDDTFTVAVENASESSPSDSEAGTSDNNEDAALLIARFDRDGDGLLSNKEVKNMIERIKFETIELKDEKRKKMKNKKGMKKIFGNKG